MSDQSVLQWEAISTSSQHKTHSLKVHCALPGDVCTLHWQLVLLHQKLCSGNVKTFCYMTQLYVWSVISISPNSSCLYSTGGNKWFYLCNPSGSATQSYSCLSLVHADLLALMDCVSLLLYLEFSEWMFLKLRLQREISQLLLKFWSQFESCRRDPRK